MAVISKKHIFILLILAACFRIGFLMFTDLLPVMWDARRYVSASLGLISYIDSSGDTDFTTDQEDRYRFKHYNDKYIQGEQIEWLAYNPFTLTEARNELFIGGPLYPAAMAIIMWLTPANDFTVIRIFNIILDLLALWLLVQIAFRFIGKKGALLAGYLYAFYLPFTFMTSVLLLETSTTLLLLLSIYMLIKGVEVNRMTYFLASGLSAGLLIINKPTAMLLFIPVAIWFYFYSRKQLQPKLILSRLLFFATPLLVITVVWGGIATARYGQVVLRDPSYSEANLRQSSNIDFEGYDLDKVESDFWTYSIAEHITSNPTGYIRLLAKKAERLWSQPANEFHRFYLLPNSWWDFMHKILILAGLLGMMILLFKDFGVGSLMLLICGYYTAIHVIFHSVSRYSFNALPLLFIAAAFLIIFWFEKITLPNNRKNIPLISATIILFVTLIFDIHWINAVFSIPLSETQTYIIYSVKLIVATLTTIYLLKIVTPGLHHTAITLTSLSLFIAVGIYYYSTSITRNEWSEYPVKISTASMKAGTRLYISEPPLTGSDEILAAVVDVYSGPGRKNTFTVRGGLHIEEFVGGEPPLLDLFYPKPTYKFYSYLEPKPIENFRQYAIIPLEPRMVHAYITQKGYFDIELAINERFNEENNYIVTSGRYPASGDEEYIPAIRFTSIERYVHKGDPRIRYPVKIYSDSTKSYYIKRNQNSLAEDTDLSPEPGKQTGRYNIYLVHFKPDGSFDVY